MPNWVRCLTFHVHHQRAVVVHSIGLSLVTPPWVSYLFVRRPQGDAPFAIPIARDFDFPRPATDRTVLYESLPASGTVIDVQLHVFAAVGATEW